MTHAETCSTGARAERRGECNCGAVDARPYRLRAVDVAGSIERAVELVVERPLTLTEAVELSLSMQELTREEAQRRCRREERAARRKRPPLGGDSPRPTTPPSPGFAATATAPADVELLDWYFRDDEAPADDEGSFDYLFNPEIDLAPEDR